MCCLFAVGAAASGGARSGVPGCASAPTAPGQFSFRVGGVVRAGQAGAGSADSRCQQVRNASFISYSRTRSALDLSRYSGSVTTAWWPSHCTRAGVRRHHSIPDVHGDPEAPRPPFTQRPWSCAGQPDQCLRPSGPRPPCRAWPSHDAVMLDAEDRNAAHLQPCPVGPGPMPVPLRPARRAPPAPSAATRPGNPARHQTPPSSPGVPAPSR